MGRSPRAQPPGKSDGPLHRLPKFDSKRWRKPSKKNGCVAKRKFCGTSVFAPNSKNKSSMWNLHSVLGVQKSAHATWTELLWKFFNFSWLRCHFLGRTGLKPSVFPLHPQLLQVKGQSQKEHFCSYIGLSCGKKAAEPKVVF